MVYFPSLGGANKLTRLLLEALALRGHNCYALALISNGLDSKSLLDCATMLMHCGVGGVNVKQKHLEFQKSGVHVFATTCRQLRAFAIELMCKICPDVVIVTSEDPGQVLLGAVFDTIGGNFVYLVQTPWSLPFGDHSVNPSLINTNLLRKVGTIITISKYLQDLMLRQGGLKSRVMRFPVFDSDPPSVGAGYGNGFVTLINPSRIKGITLFVELAKALPHLEYAVVPTWATTSEDFELLQNVFRLTTLEPHSNVGVILARTSVLVIPSIWQEGFGFVAIDAMVRGVPVVASSIGGLTEAKLGVDYLIPINPIKSYLKRFDGRGNPIPIIPDQSIELWVNALNRLTTNKLHYETISEDSRKAALDFVSSISINEIELMLSSLSLKA